MTRCFYTFFLSYMFIWGVQLHALPRKILANDKITKIPIISLESLEPANYSILKKFHLEEHVPKASRQGRKQYFANRNRTVYLTSDEMFAVKIWQAAYPSAENFIQALHAGFFEKIAKISAIILDQDNQCRGYITPYMISRHFQRQAWEAYGFLLKPNNIGVKIFSSLKDQPQNYQDFYTRLAQNIRKTGLFSIDFCPNNIAIDPIEDTLYLVDLEDVFELKNLDPADENTQKLLQYSPQDFLRMFNLLKDGDF